MSVRSLSGKQGRGSAIKKPFFCYSKIAANGKRRAWSFAFSGKGSLPYNTAEAQRCLASGKPV